MSKSKLLYYIQEELVGASNDDIREIGGK